MVSFVDLAAGKVTTSYLIYPVDITLHTPSVLIPSRQRPRKTGAALHIGILTQTHVGIHNIHFYYSWKQNYYLAVWKFSTIHTT